ncbi:sensor histidine kinase [Halobacteriovorax sp. XZX-3]|uniref:sensor histidine kinase n=1 Tax=unclassified Halobacteriovorax TaxID=2639665 RepID=UPI003710E6D1
MDNMTALYIVLLSFLLLCVVSTYVVAMVDKESDYQQFKMALIFNFFLYATRFYCAQWVELDVIFFGLKFIPLYLICNFFLNNRLSQYRVELMSLFVLSGIAGFLLYLAGVESEYYSLTVAIGSFTPGIYALAYFGKRIKYVVNFFYFTIFAIAGIVTFTYPFTFEIKGSGIWGWSAGVITYIAIMLGLLVKILEKKVDGDYKLQEELKLINAVYKAVIHDTSNDLNFLSLSLSRALKDENLTYVKLAYDRLSELIKFKAEIRKQFNKDNLSYDVELSSIVKSVVSHYQDDFNKKRVQLVVTYPHQNIEASLPISKESLVNSILGNLVSNALKFSEPRSKVYLSMIHDKTHVYFSVIDSGGGISDDIISSVTNFSKVRSSSGTRNELGSGMGLSILCYIIKRIDGEISFMSMKSGTKVIVKIPFVNQVSEHLDNKRDGHGSNVISHA